MSRAMTEALTRTLIGLRGIQGQGDPWMCDALTDLLANKWRGRLVPGVRPAMKQIRARRHEMATAWIKESIRPVEERAKEKAAKHAQAERDHRFHVAIQAADRAVLRGAFKRWLDSEPGLNRIGTVLFAVLFRAEPGEVESLTSWIEEQTKKTKAPKCPGAEARP